MNLTTKIWRWCGKPCGLLRCILSITLVLIYYRWYHLGASDKLQKFVNGSLKETIDLETFSQNILLKNRNGQLILNKSVKHLWQQPLRKWNYQNEMLMYIHVPKCSGTSFSKSLMHSRHKDGCNLECKCEYEKVQNRTCPSTLNSWCWKHFDWTEVEKVESCGTKTAPIVILRDPIDRFVSDFYYSRKRSYSSHWKMINQTLSEYLADPESMLQSQGIWFDGHVSLFSYLTVSCLLSSYFTIFGRSIWIFTVGNVVETR